MSSRLGAQDTAETGEVRTPPSDSQPPHCDPSHQRCHSAWSVPRAKISSRFVFQDTTSGGETMIPPSDSQLPHCEPSHQRCQSALSVPTTKMSSRFGAQATTRGEDSNTPPNDSQPPQLAGSSKGKTLSVPGRFTGVPAGKCRCTRAEKALKAPEEPVRR